MSHGWNVLVGLVYGGVRSNSVVEHRVFHAKSWACEPLGRIVTSSNGIVGMYGGVSGIHACCVQRTLPHGA